MYTPDLFREADRAALLELAARHPFATVIAAPTDAALEISHLPCLLRETASGLVALAHVARGNPLGERATRGERFTIVFHGPHAYVSPRWYERPALQVPTWNYAVLHASGVARATSAPETLAILRDVAARFEGEEGWSPDGMAEGAFESIARGVVGIEVAVDSLAGKYKLSQNRSPADRERVMRRLAEAPDTAAVAALMKR